MSKPDDFLVHVSEFIRHQPTRAQRIAELMNEANHYEQHYPERGKNWRREVARKLANKPSMKPFKTRALQEQPHTKKG